MRRPTLALLLGCLLLVAGVSALDGYDYYQTIEYAGCDQEVYQQDIIIHRSAGTAYNETAGGLETWHIYVGEHCREDYGDIRFVNSTGAELAYYLWPDYTSESARVCVRLEGATSAGELQVWYGNPAAATTSDEDATYDWFSDDLEEWSSTGIPYLAGTGSIDSDGGIHITSTNTDGISWPTVSALDLTGKRIEILTTLNSHASSPAQFRLQITDNISSDPGTTNGVFQSALDGRCCFGINSTQVSTALPFDTTTPRKYAFTTTANAKLWIDDDLKLTLSNSVPNYSGKYLRIWVYYHAEATISYVLIRAYSATPPAALTFSGERETASPPATPLAGLAPLTVQFTDTSTGSPTSWAWTFGDGNTSTAQNPQHTYTAPGLYTVTLNATNEYGSDTETKTDYITVYSSGTITVSSSIRPRASATIPTLSTDLKDDLIDSLGGETVPEPGNDTINWTGLISTIAGAYTSVLGPLAYTLIFSIPFLMMWITQRDMTLPGLVGALFGLFIIVRLPAEFHLVAVTFIAISIVAVVYSLVKERV